jgi:hypothetical protein
MAEQYVKGVSIQSFNYNFENWEWGDEYLNPDLLRKMHESTAALVASEIFDTMTLHIETSGDKMGQAVITSDAIEDAFFSFDLAEAVAGAVNGIETNYIQKFRKEHEAETRAHLLALRAKLSALVDIVDASPALKEPS